MDTMAVSREAIRTLREAKAWSQARLAQAAGLGLRTVQRMEADGTASAEACLAVAAALGVPVEALTAAAPPVEPAPDDGGADGRLLVFAASGIALGFALWLGRDLPPVVASHFDAAGDANGRMARDPFIAVMAVVLGGLPPLMLWGMTRALRKRTGLNLPDADYWLAPVRRPATERWLRRHFARLCAGLPVFLAFVFWRVVEANRAASAHPSLDMRWMLAGLAVFLAATGAWVAALHRRFRR